MRIKPSIIYKEKTSNSSIQLLTPAPSWAHPLAGRICHVAPEKQAKHISTLRRMLKASDSVDIKLWTKSGEIQCWRNCIPLRYNFYQGTQQFKLLDFHKIR